MPVTSLLLVDDELPLLGLLKKFLDREGFSVETAQDGAGALAAASARKFDLVVLDLHLPDISGEEVMRKLLADHPECRVLISSGMPYNSEAGGADPERVGFLLKPYVPKQLLEAIRGMSGESRKASA
jgi:DNA-binding response OmpR family regulator